MAFSRNGSDKKASEPIVRDATLDRSVRPVSVQIVGPTAPNVDSAAKHWTVAISLGYIGKDGSLSDPRYHTWLPESALPLLHQLIGEYIATNSIKAHPASKSYGVVSEAGRKCSQGHRVTAPGAAFCPSCGSPVVNASSTAPTADVLGLS